MRIVVIGAGHGGLQAARELAEAGYKVTVYEQNTRNQLSYDFHDNVLMSFFEEFGLPVPEGSYHDDPVSFVAPFSDKPLKIGAEEPTEWSIDRRSFGQWLADEAAAAGAEICYGQPVDSLWFRHGKVHAGRKETVCGVIVNGQPVPADLVIDSSGVWSPFRASLPSHYHITAQPGSRETFAVFRGFYEPAAGVPEPEVCRKKIYLKLIGEPGIAWCVVEPTGLINALVGRIGELPDNKFESMFRALCEDNPILGGKLVAGGGRYTIPVRYPLPVAVGPGYAAVGDAAFMTSPLIGSGIERSIRGGHLLAQAIKKGDSVSVKTLWSYQTSYYKTVARGDFAIDLIKRALLYANNDDLRYIFECGLLTDDDLIRISMGKAPSLTPVSLAQKWKKIQKVPEFRKTFVRAALHGVRAEVQAARIPTRYRKRSVRRWQTKLDRLYK